MSILKLACKISLERNRRIRFLEAVISSGRAARPAGLFSPTDDIHSIWEADKAAIPEFNRGDPVKEWWN